MDRCGRFAEAAVQFQKVLDIEPDSAAENNFGTALARRGRMDEAMADFRKALESDPDAADAHYNLALALGFEGGEPTAEAMAHLEKALEVQPDYAERTYALGIVLDEAGRTEEAMEHYRMALHCAEQQNRVGLAAQSKARLGPCSPQPFQAQPGALIADRAVGIDRVVAGWVDAQVSCSAPKRQTGDPHEVDDARPMRLGRNL